MCCTSDYSISSYMDKGSWSPEIACWTNFLSLWKLQGLKLCSSQQQGSIERDPVTIDFETRKHAALLENEWSFENSFEKAAPQMDFWTCGHWTIIWRACCQKGQHHIYKHFTKSLEGRLWSWWEGNFENLKTLVEKRMVRKHCMPTTKRKLALAKFGNRKVLQSPQRLDAGWPPGRAGYPWEPPGNQVGTPGREHQALPPWRQHQSIMLSLLNVTGGTSAVRIPSKGTEPSFAGSKLFRFDAAYQIEGVRTQSQWGYHSMSLQIKAQYMAVKTLKVWL